MDSKTPTTPTTTTRTRPIATHITTHVRTRIAFDSRLFLHTRQNATPTLSFHSNTSDCVLTISPIPFMSATLCGGGHCVSKPSQVAHTPPSAPLAQSLSVTPPSSNEAIAGKGTDRPLSASNPLRGNESNQPSQYTRMMVLTKPIDVMSFLSPNTSSRSSIASDEELLDPLHVSHLAKYIRTHKSHPMHPKLVALGVRMVQSYVREQNPTSGMTAELSHLSLSMHPGIVSTVADVILRVNIQNQGPQMMLSNSSLDLAYLGLLAQTLAWLTPSQISSEFNSQVIQIIDAHVKVVDHVITSQPDLDPNETDDMVNLLSLRISILGDIIALLAFINITLIPVDLRIRWTPIISRALAFQDPRILAFGSLAIESLKIRSTHVPTASSNNPSDSPITSSHSTSALPQKQPLYPQAVQGYIYGVASLVRTMPTATAQKLKDEKDSLFSYIKSQADCEPWFRDLKRALFFLSSFQFPLFEKFLLDECQTRSDIRLAINIVICVVDMIESFDQESLSSSLSSFLVAMLTNPSVWLDDVSFRQFAVIMLYDLARHKATSISASVSRNLNKLENAAQEDEQLRKLIAQQSIQTHPHNPTSRRNSECQTDDLLVRCKRMTPLDDFFANMIAKTASHPTLLSKVSLYSPRRIFGLSYLSDFDMFDCVQTFINSDRKTALIYGPSGSGKTLASLKLFHRLFSTWQPEHYFPIYIDHSILSQPLNTPVTQLIDRILEMIAPIEKPTSSIRDALPKAKYLFIINDKMGLFVQHGWGEFVSSSKDYASKVIIFTSFHPLVKNASPHLRKSHPNKPLNQLSGTNFVQTPEFSWNPKDLYYFRDWQQDSMSEFFSLLHQTGTYSDKTSPPLSMEFLEKNKSLLHLARVPFMAYLMHQSFPELEKRLHSQSPDQMPIFHGFDVYQCYQEKVLMDKIQDRIAGAEIDQEQIKIFVQQAIYWSKIFAYACCVNQAYMIEFKTYQSSSKHIKIQIFGPEYEADVTNPKSSIKSDRPSSAPKDSRYQSPSPSTPLEMPDGDQKEKSRPSSVLSSSSHPNAKSSRPSSRAIAKSPSQAEDTLASSLTTKPLVDLDVFIPCKRLVVEATSDLISIFTASLLLKSNLQGHYEFNHQYVMRYLFSQVVCDLIMKNRITEDDQFPADCQESNPLYRFQRESEKVAGYFVLDTKLESESLRVISERVGQDKNLQNRLLEIILLSRTTEALSLVASNAITILNYAGYSFCSRDLSKVKVPYADLSGANLYRTDFSSAYLQRVNLQDAMLQECNFYGADMEGANFGPCIVSNVCKSAVQCLCAFQNSFGINCIAFVASGTLDILIWDLDNQAHLQKLSGHAGEVHALASFVNSEESCYLLSGGRDLCIRRWDLATGACINTFGGHTKPVTCIVMHPTRSSEGHFCSGSLDGTICMWTITEDGHDSKSIDAHLDGVVQLRFLLHHPENNQIASAGKDRTIKIWNMIDHSCLQTFTVESPILQMDYLQRAASTPALVTIHQDTKIITWDLTLSTSDTTHVQDNHALSETAAVLATPTLDSGSGSIFALRSIGKGKIRVWNLAQGKCVCDLNFQSSDVSSYLWLQRSGSQHSQLVMGTTGGDIVLWDHVEHQIASQILTPSREIASVCTLWIGEDDLWTVVVCKDGELSMLQHENGVSFGSIQIASAELTTAVGISVKGEAHVVLGTSVGDLYVCNLRSGRMLQIVEGQGTPILDLLVPQTGSEHLHFLVVGFDGGLCTVNAIDWSVEPVVQVTCFRITVCALANVTAHGELLAVGSNDGTIAFVHPTSAETKQEPVKICDEKIVSLHSTRGSELESYIAVGTDKGRVFVRGADDFSAVCMFETGREAVIEIGSLEDENGDRALIAVTRDGLLQIWSLSRKCVVYAAVLCLSSIDAAQIILERTSSLTQVIIHGKGLVACYKIVCERVGLKSGQEAALDPGARDQKDGDEQKESVLSTLLVPSPSLVTMTQDQSVLRSLDEPARIEWSIHLCWRSGRKDLQVQDGSVVSARGISTQLVRRLTNAGAIAGGAGLQDPNWRVPLDLLKQESSHFDDSDLEIGLHAEPLPKLRLEQEAETGEKESDVQADGKLEVSVFDGMSAGQLLTLGLQIERGLVSGMERKLAHRCMGILMRRLVWKHDFVAYMWLLRGLRNGSRAAGRRVACLHLRRDWADCIGCIEVAEFHHKGSSGDPNLCAAARWMQKAVEIGSQEAMKSIRLRAEKGLAPYVRVYGELHRVGSGVEANMEVAMEYLNRAMELGDLEAAFRIGMVQLETLDEKQQSGTQDDAEEDDAAQREEAVSLVRRAADGGIAAAQYELGLFVLRGINGCESDVAEAVLLLERAIQQQSSKDDSEDDPEKTGKQGQCVDLDLNLSLDLELRASVLKTMGDLYANIEVDPEGNPAVEYDAQVAVRWYHLAAQLDHAGAQCALANMYYSGEGVSQDPIQAFEWYTKAASRDDPDALYSLGLMCAGGEGTEQDSVRAAEFYKRAADKDQTDACLALATAYLAGDGVAQDLEAAIAMYIHVQELGVAYAYTALGELYRDGYEDLLESNPRRAANMFRQAAELSDPDGACAWARCLEEGVPAADQDADADQEPQDYEEIPQDVPAAVEWYEKAAEFGSVEALYALGRLYHTGAEGVEEDIDKARDYYTQAVEAGHEDAQAALDELG
eukprot:TRINITY_DN8962_c0_g5_i1.p1 TRINITY_DN8962_c0_g5~~TRINITY_DN8962_c0_g5_i1.p1  ORF type:complete len:2655 (+),score=509.32 TRINITY_DN8962_c0_g5_i1:116-8080(+)